MEQNIIDIGNMNINRDGSINSMNSSILGGGRGESIVGGGSEAGTCLNDSGGGGNLFGGTGDTKGEFNIIMHTMPRR